MCGIRLLKTSSWLSSVIILLFCSSMTFANIQFLRNIDDFFLARFKPNWIETNMKWVLTSDKQFSFALWDIRMVLLIRNHDFTSMEMCNNNIGAIFFKTSFENELRKNYGKNWRRWMLIASKVRVRNCERERKKITSQYPSFNDWMSSSLIGKTKRQIIECSRLFSKSSCSV